jgi:pyridine nucleotide-disulfide oxidoreductase family protein
MVARHEGGRMRRLVLAGGGHSHLFVLQYLADLRKKNGRTQQASAIVGVHIVLITPYRYQAYSGMLPGWMAGHYTLDACLIDLQPLIEAAGVHWVQDTITGIAPSHQQIQTMRHPVISYDLLSMDVGSTTYLSPLLPLGPRLLPVKPLSGLMEHWPTILAQATGRPGFVLAVVGGGAAGVELALAAQHTFSQNNAQATVHLVTGEKGLFTGHASSVKRRVARYLDQTGITIHQQRASGTAKGLRLANGKFLPAHAVLAATGAQPLPWLAQSGLQRDTDGYVLVNAAHQSFSHPNVFAVGDTCSRRDVPLARSGVHAVRAGPVLAHNLYAILQNKPLKAYTPSERSLYLIACGPRYAIASWGKWSAEGAWVWRAKDWIDRRFICRFQYGGPFAPVSQAVQVDAHPIDPHADLTGFTTDAAAVKPPKAGGSNTLKTPAV